MKFQIRTLDDNLRKLDLLTQRKSHEELKAKQDLQSKRDHRDHCMKVRGVGYGLQYTPMQAHI
jgi:hypothetical protein